MRSVVLLVTVHSAVVLLLQHKNNVDWNVRMGLTSHFGGKQAYLETCL